MMSLTALGHSGVGRGNLPWPPRAALMGRMALPDESFVDAVERFCRLNLTRPIGVEDMARVAKMSRFYFSRRFEKERGITPGRYLARLRLDEAMRLLTSSEFSAKQIAGLCGFGDASYLCKVFRKNYGVSPGRFRAGCRGAVCL